MTINVSIVRGKYNWKFERMGGAIDLLVREEVPLSEAETLFRFACVRAALEMEKGNRNRAAKRLGIHRNTLLRVVKELASNQLLAEARNG